MNKMRGIIKVFNVLIFILLFMTTFYNSALASDWPSFHFDETNCGYTSSYGPITNEAAWKYEIGSPIVSSPTVSGDKVFVGANDAKLYAFNRTTGELLWSYQTGSSKSKGITCAPIVSNGKVIFGSLDCNLYALNEETGEVIWIHEFDNWMDTTPAVWNNLVFTEAWIIYSETDYEKIFCALDENNGEIKWKKELLSTIHSSPAVYNGIVYVGVGNNAPNLYEPWPGGLYAFDAWTGNILWIFTAGDGVYNADVDTAPCVAYGKVYFGCNFGTIHAVNENEGTEACHYKASFGTSSPAVYNNIVYIGSFNGNLYALHAEYGTVVWTYQTGDRIDSSPAIANNVVYIGSDSGYIFALDASTGNLIWEYQTGGEIDSSPAVVAGYLYVGSNDGFLYAFGEPLAEDQKQEEKQEDINYLIIFLMIGIIILLVLISIYISKIVMAVKRNENKEEPTDPKSNQIHICDQCGEELRIIDYSQEWYCDQCEKYG